MVDQITSCFQCIPSQWKTFFRKCLSLSIKKNVQNCIYYLWCERHHTDSMCITLDHSSVFHENHISSRVKTKLEITATQHYTRCFTVACYKIERKYKINCKLTKSFLTNSDVNFMTYNSYRSLMFYLFFRKDGPLGTGPFGWLLPLQGPVEPSFCVLESCVCLHKYTGTAR